MTTMPAPSLGITTPAQPAPYPSAPAPGQGAAAAVARVQHPDAGSHRVAARLQHIDPVVASSRQLLRARLRQRQRAPHGGGQLSHVAPAEVGLAVVIAQDCCIRHARRVQRGNQAAPLLLVPAGCQGSATGAGAAEEAAQPAGQVTGREGKA